MCKDRASQVLALCVLAMVVLAGILAIAWSWSQNFESCQIVDLTDSLKLAIENYSETVKQVLTLSTALVGLGGAVLLGLKDLANLTATTRILILASTTSFIFAVYFALLWQTWLAELLFNDCPTSITLPVMKVPFLAEMYSFVIGLALMAVIVLTTIFAQRGVRNDEEQGP